MIIWVCDKCGRRDERRPIVGSEFEYDELGYGSFGVPVDGMQDFCKSCLHTITEALSKWHETLPIRMEVAQREKQEIVRAALKAKDTPPTAPSALGRLFRRKR